jgi:hypothetical protein
MDGRSYVSSGTLRLQKCLVHTDRNFNQIGQCPATPEFEERRVDCGGFPASAENLREGSLPAGPEWRESIPSLLSFVSRITGWPLARKAPEQKPFALKNIQPFG